MEVTVINNLSGCPSVCGYEDVRVDYDYMRMFEGLAGVAVEIDCKHRSVCKLLEEVDNAG